MDRRATSKSARAALVLAGVLGATTASAESPDAVMAQFFSIWDANARVTPAAVQSLYAQRVVYYGESLTNAGVYANKRAFIRRWPDRRYAVVPGSIDKGCDESRTRCSVSVTLAWHASSGARGASAHGLTRVTLALAQQDGTLKVTRESGHPVQER